MRLTFALIALLLSGCGYVWDSKPGGEREYTLHLDTVENHLFPHRPGLEYELTDRLKEEIATQNRLNLSDGAAEVRLKVSLTRFNEPIKVEDLKSGDPVEIQLSATAMVDVEGAVYASGGVRRSVTRSVSYVPGLGDSRRDGLDRLWRDLARGIVDVAEDDWAGQENAQQ